MANTRTYNRSFNGGEISPEMFGRIDDEKVQVGAAKVRNMIVVPQGPVQNRPGSKLVREVKDSTKKVRLIPFTYSIDQTMVIELGNQYIRFHTQGSTLMSGGVPYEIASPYLEADLFDIHYVQSGDVLTLVHPSYAPRELRRIGATNWTLTEIAFAAAALSPTGLSIVASRGESINITAITKANPGVVTVASKAQYVEGDGVYISGVGGMTQLSDGFYTINTVGSGNTSYSLKNYDTGVPLNTTSYSTYTSGGTIQYGDRISDIDNYYVVTTVSSVESPASAPVHAVNNLYINGSYNTISWTAVTGADRYNVYKKQSGLFGYIGQTATTSFVDNNIAPDMGKTPPIYDSTFGYGGIKSVTILDSGMGYGQSYTGGSFLSVTVSNSGSGFTSVNPSLTVSDPTGSGATFTVNTTGVSPNRTISSITVTNAGSNYSNPIFVLSDSTGTGAVLSPVLSTRQRAPTTITVTDPTGSGAELVPVITGSSITDVLIVKPGNNYSSPSITISDPMGIDAFLVCNAADTHYPGAVSYFEQRRVFAATSVSPQELWMTRSGTESDMSYSIPVKDDDRIDFKVAARERNVIRHVVPLNQLILLTDSAEWRVTSVNSDALTPTSISVRPQSYIGASNVQPSIVNNSLVYCAARGGHVRELGYSWQANGFITGDLSLRAPHLFDSYEIVDMTYQKSPHPLLWFVSNNGKLLGLTYIPEQQVGAWHQHDTDGAFESVTCVAEGAEDHIYIVVKRTINGQQKRYIERFESQQFDLLENAFYLDCGLTYNGNNSTATTVTVSGGTAWDKTEVLTVTSSSSLFTYPAQTDVNDAIVLTDTSGNKYRLKIVSTASTTVASAIVDNTLPIALRNTATETWAFARDSVSGLSHLEGKTVSILADGAVMPQAIVSGGTVSLLRAAVKINVGLPFQSDLQTLPMAINIDAFGQGRYKNINKVWLRVYRSSGIFIGPDPDNLVEAKQRTTEPYGSPPELKSDEVLVVLTPSWASSGQIYIRQADPLPLLISGATIEVAIGG